MLLLPFPKASDEQESGSGLGRWGVRKTIYFHIFTGPFAPQARAVGDVLAWSKRKGNQVWSSGRRLGDDHSRKDLDVHVYDQGEPGSIGEALEAHRGGRRDDQREATTSVDMVDGLGRVDGRGGVSVTSEQGSEASGGPR